MGLAVGVKGWGATTQIHHMTMVLRRRALREAPATDIRLLGGGFRYEEV